MRVCERSWQRLWYAVVGGCGISAIDDDGLDEKGGCMDYHST